jgi:phage gpG-like protein
MLELKVDIPAATVRYFNKLVNMPKALPGAIKTGLDIALQQIVENIKDYRLSGSGPYPASQHRLGERSGNLKQSVYAKTAIQGNRVIGVVGSDVEYAPVHEYGAVIHAVNAPFLVFKVKGKTIRTKSVVIPAREPFGYELGLARTLNVIAKDVTDEIMALGSE